LSEIETEIILTEDTTNPSTLDEIGDIEITSQSGETFELEEIAEIQETAPKASITRLEGETVNQLSIRLNDENANDQGIAAQVGQQIVDYYTENDSERAKELGLEEGGVEIYSEGATAEFTRTFTELGIALVLAVFLIYFLLVVFFKSFTMPLTIMFTIPLTFLGAFPALAAFVGDEFGFLETIGLIILVGLVVNVAIYLIDLAGQKVEEGWERKKAISFASGVRLRPIFLTNITAIASLAPLFFTSDFYRSIATVIMFGLTTSAITSLFTTPILYIFFKWLSEKYHQTGLLNKVMFILLPVLGLVAPFLVAGFMQTEEMPLMDVLTENPWLYSFMILIITPIVYMIYWIVDELRGRNQSSAKTDLAEES
jgi:HAE1 family hydrophobic/amphiphilic exporter-1